MKCSLCGGLVTWRGPLVALTHTECESCGAQNCQEVEYPAEEIEAEVISPVGVKGRGDGAA